MKAEYMIRAQVIGQNRAIRRIAELKQFEISNDEVLSTIIGLSGVPSKEILETALKDNIESVLGFRTPAHADAEDPNAVAGAEQDAGIENFEFENDHDIALGQATVRSLNISSTNGYDAFISLNMLNREERLVVRNPKDEEVYSVNIAQVNAPTAELWNFLRAMDIEQVTRIHENILNGNEAPAATLDDNLNRLLGHDAVQMKAKMSGANVFRHVGRVMEQMLATKGVVLTQQERLDFSAMLLGCPSAQMAASFLGTTVEEIMDPTFDYVQVNPADTTYHLPFINGKLINVRIDSDNQVASLLSTNLSGGDPKTIDPTSYRDFKELLQGFFSDLGLGAHFHPVLEDNNEIQDQQVTEQPMGGGQPLAIQNTEPTQDVNEVYDDLIRSLNNGFGEQTTTEQDATPSEPSDPSDIPVPPEVGAQTDTQPDTNIPPRDLNQETEQKPMEPRKRTRGPDMSGF